MCQYTYTFYECGHRIEDNVRGCWRYKRGEAHCDVDNPEIKRTRCAVSVSNREGTCPRCLDRERTRVEKEALQKDMRRARRLDAQEQENSKSVHEAHLKKIQRQSYSEYQTQEDFSLTRILEESRKRAELDLAKREAEIVEASRREYLATMEDRYGTVVEDGSTHLEAIKHKSTVDYQHRDWDGDVRRAAARSDSGITELEVRMRSSFSIKESYHRSEAHQCTSSSAAPLPPPPPPPPPPSSGPAFPPLDYSQSPKDQNYGRFMIGTRHQPIHQSQDIPQTSSTMRSPLGQRAPAHAVRLAGTVAPSTPSVVEFAVPSGDQRSRLRPAATARRPNTSVLARTEQVPNELEALWSRRGIQREVDEEDSSVCSITASQSASQVPHQASTVVNADESEMEWPKTPTS